MKIETYESLRKISKVVQKLDKISCINGCKLRAYCENYKAKNNNKSLCDCMKNALCPISQKEHKKDLETVELIDKYISDNKVVIE